MTTHVETKSDLDDLRGLVLPELRTVLARLDPWLAEMAGYHLGWGTAGDQGELFHPALTVLAAEALGGSGPSAVPGAVAVELAHNFTLIHDDIIDSAESRRGRPALWRRFGISPAIMVGDALRTLAFELLGEHENHRPARMLGAAMRDLFSGQVRDLRFRDRSWQGVGIDEYRAMAMAKTGALMSAALAIGAELAGGGPEAVAILAQVGQHLGLASQVMDDVPGALIERSGGRALAQREIDHARELLAVVPMPAAVRDQFAALCEGLVERAR